LNIADV
jgi:phage-related minor tail protein